MFPPERVPVPYRLSAARVAVGLTLVGTVQKELFLKVEFVTVQAQGCGLDWCLLSPCAPPPD